MLETFIRPVELSRKASRLNPSIFNAYRLLLNHETAGFVFLPLRGIQFQAILCTDEILFVDSLGPYHGDADDGGRCVSFAWQFADIRQRISLIDPANYDFVGYCIHEDVDNNRLVTELSSALTHYQTAQLPPKYQNRQANIITLKL
jgi:hypothetical protein